MIGIIYTTNWKFNNRIFSLELQNTIDRLTQRIKELEMVQNNDVDEDCSVNKLIIYLLNTLIREFGCLLASKY